MNERVGVLVVVDVDQGNSRLPALEYARFHCLVLAHEVGAEPASQRLSQGAAMLHWKVVVSLGQVLDVLVRVDVDLEDKLQELNELAVLRFGCDACIKARC